MASPKAELAAYQAMITRLPNPMLVQKYQEEFDNLRKTSGDATRNLDINQLPVFRTAILKAIIKEIKKRQGQTQEQLLSPEQIKSADKFIQEQEKRERDNNE